MDIGGSTPANSSPGCWSVPGTTGCGASVATGKVIREATKLLSKVPGSETGSNPVGIAAAMLYIISVTSGYPFTQKQFAEAAKINSQTITKSAKRLNGIIKKNKLGKYVDHNTRYHRIV